MSWTDKQGKTCEKDLCTHSNLPDLIFLLGLVLGLCCPHQRPPYKEQAQDLPFGQTDLPGVQPAPPTCNHLSLQVCSPGSEAKSRREEARTREGPGALQAGPRLKGNQRGPFLQQAASG